MLNGVQRSGIEDDPSLARRVSINRVRARCQSAGALPTTGLFAGSAAVRKRPGTVPILRSLRSKMGLSPLLSRFRTASQPDCVPAPEAAERLHADQGQNVPFVIGNQYIGYQVNHVDDCR